MYPEPTERPTPTRSFSTPDEAVELIEFSDQEPERRVSAHSQARRRLRRSGRLSVVLFLATGVTTFLAGFVPGNLDGALGVVLPIGEHLVRNGSWPEVPGFFVTNGLVFSACLLTTLLAHEMGHFLFALRHRVPATLPFFIPLPFGPFGTMGAVILQDGSRADRRQLFDIAIAGPLAGLLVALPVTWYGVAESTIAAFGPNRGGYGNPLLLEWIVALVHRPLGPGEDIALNAPLFAGWVGIFITALNLLPVGQLDGGHILYTLIGKKAHIVAYVILAAAVGWMVFTRTPHYALIVLMLLVIGPRHPPTADDGVPLGAGRILLGLLLLGFLVIGFTPTPIIV